MTAQLAGLGAVTGYGWGTEPLLQGVAAQTTAAAHAEVDGIRALAALVPEPGAEPLDPNERYEHMVGAAVDEALAEAAGRGWEPGDRVGVLFCTGIADIRAIRDNFFSGGRPRPSLFPRMLHTAAGSALAQRHGWTGPNLVVNAACSSGNAALQLADAWLQGGLATDVVVVGAELCVIAEIVTGFRRMRVLLGENRSAADCRPFQEGSRGFFLGEAAVALVVTNRADSGRATYLGGATTHDAYHLVAPEPEGRELARCFVDALAAAGAAPGDIAVIKAHGSGTPINDGIEAALADRLFPDRTRLCSYKPLLGHCMAAAALAELAGLLAGYEAGALPARVSDDPAHPRLADGEPPPDGLVLCTSVGLGGTNTAVVLDIHR
ncbi:MAG TPA: beta-ketoacyl synthase N-terminal-like domain-containing protein [Acidimicrobiales bacterium]